MNVGSNKKMLSMISKLKEIQLQLEVLSNSETKQYKDSSETFKQDERGAYSLAMLSALGDALDSSDALIHHLEDAQGCFESCKKHDDEIKQKT